MAQALTIPPSTDHCYTQEDVKKLATAITDLKKCQVELTEKDRVIREKLTTFDGATGPAFWQEPSFVAGSIVVSFSLGGLAAWYLTRNK